MATIAGNVFTQGATQPSGTGNSTGAASRTDGAAGTSPNSGGTFMQLVNGMIQGGTTGDQLPANLVDFLLTGDSGALEGVETDTTADTDADDEDGDEAASAALAALFAAMQPFQTAPATSASGSDSTGVSSISLEGAQGGDAQALLAATQDALKNALEGAAKDGTEPTLDAAGQGFDVDGTNAPAGQASTGNSASHLQSMLQAHRAAEGAPQAASGEVRTPVGAKGWSDELGNQLTMMAANGRETASLKLSPEHLGPLEIRIAMKDGEASVMFNASNSDTRSALEQSLPRLREMFASQGLVLGDANVSRDTPRDLFKPATFAKASRDSSDGGDDASVKAITMKRLGLVDTYV